MPLWNTPMYRRWRGILSRCQNQHDEKWRLYGARGVYVCERWQVFENFLADMGMPPSPSHTVGRIDNDGPYSPENCRWETPLQQSNNTRRNVRIDGQTMAQHALRLGVTPETIAYRMRHGLNPLAEEKGRKRNYGRTVIQKALDGSVVCLHPSLPAASKGFANPDAALKGIWRVLNGQRSTYQGFRWEYAPQDTSELRPTNLGHLSTS